MPLILGVDPGVSGALAVIDSITKKLVYLTSVVSKYEFINYGAIKNTVLDYDIAQCYMEAVHAMPWDSKKAADTFARSVGVVDMALAWTSIPVVKITPQRWQIKLDLARKYETKVLRKQAHWKLANNTFPDAKIKLPQADAVLIAMYGVMVENKTNTFKDLSIEDEI